MKVGSPFNPYRLFHGAFLPNWLLRRTEVTAGSKLCYARLCQYSGKNGDCYPKQDTLAEELGVTDRTVRTYLKELEDLKLMRTTQNGFGQSNSYEFLWHPWAEESSVPDRKTTSGQERKTSSGQEALPLSTLSESYKEIGLSEVSSFQQQLSELFNRQLTDHWSYEEESYFVAVYKRPNHLKELHELTSYKARKSQYFPQSLCKLLGGWTEYLDRARCSNDEPEVWNPPPGG